LPLTISLKFISFGHYGFFRWLLSCGMQPMKSKSWLFIVMNPRHQVRTFRVERRTFFILACGGIFFACALAFFGNRYFTLLEEMAFQTRNINHLLGAVSTLERGGKKVSSGSERNLSPLPVVIDELRVIRQAKRGGFVARFRLLQLNSQSGPYSGTLVMVARNDSVGNPVCRVIPDMPLEKGVPQHPEKGKPFEVKGQGFVEAFFEGSSGDDFRTLTVYLYAPGGRLILQKSTEIARP